MTLARLTMAARIWSWPESILGRFCSQYGSPSSYGLIERAKLLGSYGDVARLIDVVQQAVLAPYTKSKKPKSVIPKEVHNKPEMTDEDRAFYEEVLGVNRQGEGMDENAIWPNSSDSMD